MRELEPTAVGAVDAVLAVAQQHRRPDHGVEDDVVLALEVVVLGVGVLPPLPPGVGLAGGGRPLDRGRQVADHRVEPDVDALVLVLGVAGHRDPHPPVEVAGDRPRTQLVEQREREVAHVRTPVVVAGDPAAQRSANCGRSRNRCLVSRNSGTLPSICERGSIRSDGSSWLPQLSHWSPRASG